MQAGQLVASTSAPEAIMFSALRVPIFLDNSYWAMLKLPPHPQQVPASAISLRVQPEDLMTSLGWEVMPSEFFKWQGS